LAFPTEPERFMRTSPSRVHGVAIRHAVTLSLIVVAAISTWVSPAGAAPDKRPNVIIFLADDLGWSDVGFHGEETIETPSLDRLAREGVELHRFYTTPICSPTRAALMTGRDPMRLGVVYGVIMPWMTNGIHPAEHFMPESFRAAGYQTAIVGKWHLGHAQETFTPRARGVDHFYGHLHTEVGYFPPFANQGGRDFQSNGVAIDDEGYETFLLADEASRWIRERDEEKPFFLYVPFIAPHTPLDAPKDLLEKYADMEDDRKPARSEGTDRTRLFRTLLLRDSARPVYAAVVDAMDQAVGRVLDTLDEQGLAEDTIVLFFSDNGGAAYATGGADNVPLRGGKGETFEGGIRVVSVMRWPGAIAAGSRMDSIMSAMDVFPTLAEASGIEMKNAFDLDGRSLWSAIAEGKRIPREDLLFFASETPIHGTFNVTAFNDEWKLVQTIKQGLLSADIENWLFQLDEDPNERNNVADAHPEVVAELAGEIHTWRTMYPVAGTRNQLVPPPGWRAPLDWTDYPIPIEKLQDTPAPGMPPPETVRVLDFMHGEAGRLIYDCEPVGLLGGGLCK
jgi:arylsulfatase B